MKESFSPAIQEVKNTKEVFSPINNFFKLIDNSKEYLKTIPENLKKKGLITLACTMGVFGVVEANNNASNIDKTIQDLNDRVITTEQAVDSIYSNIDKDGTYSYVEYNHHQLGQDISSNINVSGPTISIDNASDTISMGNYEAVEYSVMVTDQNENNNQYEFKQEGKFLSGVRPYEGTIDNANVSNKNSFTSFGNTEQQAVISAISGLSSLIKTNISIIKESKNEQSNTEIEMEHKSGFTEVSTSESNNILKDVKIVIKKTAEGFSAEAFCS